MSKPILLFTLISFLMLGLNSCNKQKDINLKIMSYNIRHGEGMDNILDLSRTVNIIKSYSPELCALQEVDNYCLRSDSVGQTNFLAEKTGMEGTFGKFMNFQGGEYGMATLSSKPIISSRILALPDAKLEPRTSIVQEVEIAQSCTLVFANVHFEWIDDEEGVENRLRQAEVLLQYIDSLGHATIITGDFNCKPNSPTMKFFKKNGFVFAEKGEDNLSYQGEHKAEIDHLIYRNSANVEFKIISTELLEEPVISDHRPLIVDMVVCF